MTDQTKHPDREDLMALVRQSLKTSAPATLSEPAPAVDPTIARLATADDDLVDLFHDRAVKIGMHLERVTSESLLGALTGLLREKAIKTVVLGSVPLLGDLVGSLTSEGIEVVTWKGTGSIDNQFDVDCGITGVHVALAETGTLVVFSDAENSRGLSLAPPIHVAVVRKSDILPDMLDLWAQLKGIPNTELPSNMVFITGPSKTADIEGELVTGVHGPESVHIFLVDE